MDPSNDIHEYCTGGYSPDDIVITGMAGRFPLCDNVGELKEAMYEQKRLLVPSNERFEEGSCELPFASSGIINNIDKLDAEFFGIPSACAQVMDPGQRKILEVCYEAIADSGYDPSELKGENIGIYNATSNEDAKDLVIDTVMNLKNFAVGFLRCMNANRFSFMFDFHGPSMTIDTACSSSGVAMWCAFNDIREGRVDAAIVSGVQLCLNPFLTYCYFKSGIVSPTGISIPFDAEANGFVRTEAACALFLQKASVARRAYATLCTIKHISAGYVPEGVYVPSAAQEVRLFQDILKDTSLEPEDIDYIEAHGTGTSVGDPIELNAISEVFCRNRKEPLHIGSAKSNLGHSEAAAGLCGVIKCLIGFESGLIPPHYGYKTPNPKCLQLLQGDLKVVTESYPLASDYIQVNSFGFGGSFVAMVLKKNPIERPKERKANGLPKLILFPATTSEGVDVLFQYIRNTIEVQDEFCTLLHKLSFASPIFKPFRGYALLQDGKEPVFQSKNALSDKRQIWFIMTGMGCQWPGMGLELMAFDVFAKSMKKSAKVLKPLGIDLFELLHKDKNYLEMDRRIVPAFVSITSIQVALIDLLKSIHIHPDGIIGHSTGELAAAYADGCCTAEQTVLSAYWRGKAVESVTLPYGGMAAVGLTWEDAKKMCPENIYPACHNAYDSITISGLQDPLNEFVEKLKSENIFARTVNTYGYAFHCKLIWPAAEKLRSALDKILTDPKPRSERWISSSYLENDWGKHCCKMAAPEYFVHNLMSPVHFYESVKKIPSDAITIEIGPHFLLQSILKRTIGSKALYIGLMKRNHENNASFLLESLGKLYIEGLDPKIERLYPPIKFPVPRNTAVISDLIKWNYSKSWIVPKWVPKSSSFSYYFKLDGDDAYLLDHCIDGRSLFPATGYVTLAWQALAKKMKRKQEELPITVENFKIHRATILSPTGMVEFRVTILDASGTFEVIAGNSCVASGRIYEAKALSFAEPPPVRKSDDSTLAISGNDIYDELKIYGFEYGPAFKGLLEIDINGSQGLVSWNDNWIPFLDSLLLFFGVINNYKSFLLPTGALSFKIDPRILKEAVSSESHSGLPVSFNANTSRCRSVGVEITKLVMDPAPRHAKSDNEPTLEEYRFVPYITNCLIPDYEKIHLPYMSACNKVIDKIGQTLTKNTTNAKFVIKNIENFDVENYINNMSAEHKMLSVLKQISELENGIKALKESEMFQIYYKNIGKDTLNSALLNRDYMRMMFDIIFENSFQKLSILEINNKFPLCLPYISKTLQKFNNLMLKTKVLISPKETDLDIEMLEAHNIQWYSYERMVPVCQEKKYDIIISSFCDGTEIELQNHVHLLSSTLDKKGFLLMFHKTQIFPPEAFLCSLFDEKIRVQSANIIESFFHAEDLIIISKISNRLGGILYLLRHPAPVGPHKILHITERNAEVWMNELKTKLSDNTSETVWLTCEDNKESGIIGLVNCLRKEPGGERIRCIFKAMVNEKSKFPLFNIEGNGDQSICSEILKKNLLMNVWKNNSWGSFRHIEIEGGSKFEEVEYSYICCKKYGDLSSFFWIESPLKYFGFAETQLAHVYYSSLNFKDVMIATAKIPHITIKGSIRICDGLGFEFSGRNIYGQRVAGMATSGGMATFASLHPQFQFNVPDQWTLEEAATVPVVYATCYYALMIRGKLLPGKSILIHSGTGGVGLAAINIALSMNCKIFATVGNEKKKDYLRKQFPQIDSDCIGCSRDLTFEDLIMNKTKGRGVDVVLNSLADDKFQASVRCVARHGRFIELGKYDFAMDHSLNLKTFLKNISFHAVFLDEILDNEPDSIHTLNQIVHMIKDGVKRGVVKPLDRTVFKFDEVEKAYRYMGSGKHIGKVLLKIRDEEPEKHFVPKTMRMKAVRVTYFYPHKVYIIIGGLGGFGIELTKWLIRKGAENIILTSRYGARTPYHHLCLKRWRQEGMNVRVSTLNVAVKIEAMKLLEEASRIGPVGGIFNSAVVLKDAFFENTNAKYFEEVCAPKAEASRNLDELSRMMCLDLDYFVCFSSISCGRGNAGQTNYGYANSVMERVCERRRNVGLHGLAIQWGIIGDVGVVHRHMGEDAMIAGVCAQNVKSCLDTLDLFCQYKYPVVSSYVVTDSSRKKGGQGDALAQIAKIFGLSDPSEFSSFRSFSEMGLDSMIGIEVKHLLETTCGVTFTVQEIQEMKIEDVKTLIEKIESERTDAQSSLLTTESISIPQFSHASPILPINDKMGKTPVFIVNVTDNDMSHLTALGKTLTNPAFALVWTKDAPTTDIKTLASWYLNKIKEMTKSPYHLIGFETSGSLAFEMTLQNEKSNNSIKTFTLLNSSTSLMKTLKDDEVNVTDVGILSEFANQFMPGIASKIQDELSKVTDLDQRIKVITNAFSNSCNQASSKNDLSDAIHSYLKKMKLLQVYSPEFKMEKDLCVIEDSAELLANDVAQVKNLLSMICSGKLTIHRMPEIKQLSSANFGKIASLINPMFGNKE